MDSDFGRFAVGFWWLIFPLMWFVFGGFGMYLRHRRSQQAMDILKTYAAQGKDPPPEVMAAVTGMAPPGGPTVDPYGQPMPGPGPDPYYGRYPYGPWMRPWGWGGYGRWGWGWRGPLWAWSRVVTFAAIAIGFSFAGQYMHEPDANEAFHVVAVIMGVLALGFGFMALLHTLFYRNAPRP